jgi:hypothetical protein
MSSTRRLPFASLCLLWAGIVIGVAFAEALKFRVPTLSRSVALDVGRTVFGASQWVQLGLLALALVSAVAGRVSRFAWASLALVAVSLLLQMRWLFPLLEAQAQGALAGAVPTDSAAHRGYVRLEALKLLALGVAAYVSLWPEKPGPRAPSAG